MNLRLEGIFRPKFGYGVNEKYETGRLKGEQKI